MADTKISLLDPITAPQDPAKMFVPLFAQDGTPLNARMNFAEMFKTPKQLTLNASSAGSSVIFTTPADGRLLLTDNAGTSFGRLQLGGTTASFPSLKRNATGIDFRLADDSGYAPITAAAIISSTTIAATAGVSGTKFTASNTVTADAPAFDAAQTWNNAAITFTGMKLNVTDAASNAASKLLDLQTGGTPRFSVQKDAVTHINGTSVGGTGEVLKLTSSFGTASLRVGGGGTFNIGGTLKSDGDILGSNNSSLIGLGTTTDVYIARDAADVLALRRSTNAELVRVYETYTDSTTFSRGVFGFRDNASGGTGTGSVSTGVLRIGTEKGQIGGTAAAISIVTDGTERINISGTANTVTLPSNSTLALGSGGILRTQYINDASNTVSSFVLNGNGNAIFSNGSTTPRFQFAGTTSSFPSFKRSGTTLQCRLADDTGFSQFTASAIGLDSDVLLTRPAANILGVTNGSTGPGVLAIDNVQGTNFERLKAEWASSVARIGTSKGGSGTARDLALITNDTVRLTIYGGGGINCGSDGLTAYSLNQIHHTFRIQGTNSPASGAAGNAGEICWDANYIYVCTASGAWKRVALTGGY